MAAHPAPRLAPPLASRLAGVPPTVFSEFSALAVRTGSVNLGQGFPDVDGPASVVERAVTALREGANQYAPGTGVPALRRAVAAHQRRHHGIELDPDTQVCITTGATEGIAAALLALVEPGDEVVLLEPSYDSYDAVVAMAGGLRRGVTLRGPGFRLDAAALRAAVTPRTRVLLLNTPHNPTGTVLTREELQAVADVAIEHDLVVGSAGKTFNTTGWKIGWICGPAPLVTAVRTAKQFLTYVNGGPFQPAVAAGLRLPDEYFTGIARDLEYRRDVLVEGLRAAGLPVTSPEATYFATVDVRPVQPDGDGLAFCRSLPERAGVVAVPTVVFYDPAHAHLGRHLVRFAFCKRDEVLGEAVRRLRELS